MNWRAAFVSRKHSEILVPNERGRLMLVSPSFYIWLITNNSPILGELHGRPAKRSALAASEALAIACSKPVAGRREPLQMRPLSCALRIPNPLRGC
jgi:hypothetical protein